LISKSGENTNKREEISKYAQRIATLWPATFTMTADKLIGEYEIVKAKKKMEQKEKQEKEKQSSNIEGTTTSSATSTTLTPTTDKPKSLTERRKKAKASTPIGNSPAPSTAPTTPTIGVASATSSVSPTGISSHTTVPSKTLNSNQSLLSPSLTTSLFSYPISPSSSPPLTSSQRPPPTQVKSPSPPIIRPSPVSHPSLPTFLPSSSASSFSQSPTASTSTLLQSYVSKLPNSNFTPHGLVLSPQPSLTFNSSLKSTQLNVVQSPSLPPSKSIPSTQTVIPSHTSPSTLNKLGSNTVSHSQVENGVATRQFPVVQANPLNLNSS